MELFLIILFIIAGLFIIKILKLFLNRFLFYIKLKISCKNKYKAKILSYKSLFFLNTKNEHDLVIENDYIIFNVKICGITINTGSVSFKDDYNFSMAKYLARTQIIDEYNIGIKNNNTIKYNKRYLNILLFLPRPRSYYKETKGSGYIQLHSGDLFDKKYLYNKWAFFEMLKEEF